jgi:diketogulonate reductase-like aldo/keto reductase
MIHWPEPGLPCEETLEVMQELQARGLTRHLGVCNFPPSLFERACRVADLLTLQVEYHPYLSQEVLLQACRERGMFLTAYAPLARGRVLDNPVLTAVGRAHGRTPAQVALRWLVQQPGVAAIPKASSTARLRENLEALDLELTEDEMRAVSSLDEDLRVVNSSHAPSWERP